MCYYRYTVHSYKNVCKEVGKVGKKQVEVEAAAQETKQEKKTKDRGGRCYMYAQQIRHLPPHLRTDALLRGYLADNLPRGAQWAYVVHDKDYYLPEHEAQNPEHKAGTPREPHIHISVYLPNAKTITAMAACIGDKPQYVQKFTGDNGKQNLFSYLIHATEGSKLDGKYEYPFSEVQSNFDFDNYVKGISTAIKGANIDRDTVRMQVLAGDLRMIDFVMRDDLMAFYLQNKTYVGNLIDAMYKRQMNEAKKDGDKVKVIYMQGAEGSGKSTFARRYALKHYRDYAISSSHNDAVQDYLGQDVMIFDDARPGDFSASDWLKLLDPYNNNCSVCSRYYNKYLNVKCIIVTTTAAFEEFFVYAPRKESDSLAEPVGQFMRRFDFVVKCVATDTADIRGTHAEIYEIEPCREYSKRVGNSMVGYRWRLKEKPSGVTDMVIAAKHEKSKLVAGEFDV